MVLWTYHRVDGDYAYFVGQHFTYAYEDSRSAGIFYTFPDDVDRLSEAGSVL